MERLPENQGVEIIYRPNMKNNAGCLVEPQVSRFVNFTQCDELVPRRHFWQM